MVGIFNNHGCPSQQIGGTDDHVHALFLLGRTQTLSDIVEEVKKSSSKWMKTQGVQNFSWQSGYGAFSVGEPQVKTVIKYIQNQKIHHEKSDFKGELLRLFHEYGVDYDEKYLWD